MSSAVVLAIMAAAAQPVAAPPPAITIVRESAPRTAEQDGVQAISQFDVAIAVEREVIWSGTVRVGLAGANYSQSLSQAEEPCAGEAAAPRDGYRHNTSVRQINFTLGRRGSREIDAYSINVRWQRPVGACQGGGTRGVTLDQQITVAPGQTVRLKGDAGLEVTLTRRAR
jgi:hypothetical protein